MAISLVARTVLLDAAPSTGAVPFGRTGCALLPDGSYVVGVYIDDTPSNKWTVWKVAADGTALGDLTVDIGSDADGRIHLIALDGELVQVLYETAGSPGGASYVLDCSGDDPVIVDQWEDTLGANGFNDGVHSLYMPALGVALVAHVGGVTLYRRGRPLITRGGDATGLSYGIFPHPTDPTKAAVWYTTGLSGVEFRAWELTVMPSDSLLLVTMGVDVPSDDIFWMVGGGSPYRSTALALQEGSTGGLEVIEAVDPTTVLWSDPEYVADSYTFGINSDPVCTSVGDGVQRFAFAHEIWRDESEFPGEPEFAIRVGVVDTETGVVVSQEMVEYGASSPDGPSEALHYVSLLTGSHCISHRNGEIVVSTCIVEQEGTGTDYYSVVSWKLTGGELARFSGKDDGAWRLGVSNLTGRTGLRTSGGWAEPAGVTAGLDAPAHPVWVKTSDGWKVLGRVVDPTEDALTDPPGPVFTDVTFNLTDINADHAEAVVIAGPTYTASGKSWGAFIEQDTPPDEADLADSSDGTTTTLLRPDNVGGDVEVFTARLAPATAIPGTGIPVAAALTVRSSAAAGDESFYLDGMVTNSTSQAAIRGQLTLDQQLLGWSTGPTMKTTSFGVYGTTVFVLSRGGRLRNPYAVEQPLDEALLEAVEQAAQWWDEHIADPDFFIVVQSAASVPDQGPVEISEMSFTIRYLIP